MARPTFEEIENGIHYVYKRCPVQYIPRSIHRFMELYDYHKTFPAAPMPDYANVNPRFVKAFRYYESKFNDNIREKMKDGR